jgi:hypothetical protein
VASRAGSTLWPAPPPSSSSTTASASTWSPRHHRYRHQRGRERVPAEHAQHRIPIARRARG